MFLLLVFLCFCWKASNLILIWSNMMQSNNVVVQLVLGLFTLMFFVLLIFVSLGVGIPNIAFQQFRILRRYFAFGWAWLLLLLGRISHWEAGCFFIVNVVSNSQSFTFLRLLNSSKVKFLRPICTQNLCLLILGRYMPFINRYLHVLWYDLVFFL